MSDHGPHLVGQSVAESRPGKRESWAVTACPLPGHFPETSRGSGPSGEEEMTL